MFLQTTVLPATEPLVVQDARDHLHLVSTREDSLIGTLIAAARAHAENYLRRRLITQTVVLHGLDFGCCADLGVSPLLSVTSVTYTGLDGVSATLAPSLYRVIASQMPPRVEPVFGAVWPVTLPGSDTVQVTMQVGYGAAVDVPAPIRVAMLLLISHWFHNREAVAPGAMSEVPQSVTALLGPYVAWV